jgi:hypothetical protein
MKGTDEREMSLELAGRLREVRLERFGQHGAPMLAEILRVPARTWANYEAGVNIPGVVLLRFLVATGTEPEWLLTGCGPRQRLEPVVQDAEVLFGGADPCRH